ncbi:GNAT family N-acetyltransferase [Luedemannella helvata]|uniref:GNAT family N-acetyltransferase n=1 Tax=Luedemannella helvata TaxID=349315 RepID=UPI0031D86637
MRLREWDPGSAPEAELRLWLDAYNEALTADLPHDPLWGINSLRGYLSVTMPGQRRFSWIVEEDDAEPGTAPLLGVATLLLLDGMGVIEVVVVPKARRQGVGRTLLAATSRRALREGVRQLGVEVIGGTTAVDFYEAHGFRWAYVEMRSLLDLRAVDWDHLREMAAGVVTGYYVEYHQGGLPESILGAYAEAKEQRRLTPPGDLELRPSSYSAERLRHSIATLRARGLHPHIVLAVHESTGWVAGLTEVVVPAQHPTRADQYDTIVRPEFNGLGLGRALKARMLLELRDAEPQLREVQTWHATENEQLQQVNDELGFRADHEWREYDADAVELTNLLRDVPA